MAKCGRETEIYSRVVGYHRPVKNWNKGKRVEFSDRRAYRMDGPRGHARLQDEGTISGRPGGGQ